MKERSKESAGRRIVVAIIIKKLYGTWKKQGRRIRTFLLFLYGSGGGSGLTWHVCEVRDACVKYVYVYIELREELKTTDSGCF